MVSPYVCSDEVPDTEAEAQGDVSESRNLAANFHATPYLALRRVPLETYLESFALGQFLEVSRAYGVDDPSDFQYMYYVESGFCEEEIRRLFNIVCVSMGLSVCVLTDRFLLSLWSKDHARSGSCSSGYPAQRIRRPNRFMPRFRFRLQHKPPMRLQPLSSQNCNGATQGERAVHAVDPTFRSQVLQLGCPAFFLRVNGSVKKRAWRQ